MKVPIALPLSQEGLILTGQLKRANMGEGVSKYVSDI